jgi:hypothetical protein
MQNQSARCPEVGRRSDSTILRHRRLLTLWLITGIAIAMPPLTQRAWTQDAPSEASELARMNLSRVAASVAQVRAVLTTNAGLMVTLKRWVARDATSHGQIVRDDDLTDDAIYARLEADTEFRSVATALLQQYGFLVPDINPQSDAAKEHEILVQQRGRLLAEREARHEQPLTGAQPGRSGLPAQQPGPLAPSAKPRQAALPGTLQDPRRAASCNSPLADDCNPIPGEIGAESLAGRDAGFTTTPAASSTFDSQPFAPGYPPAPIHPLEMVRRPNPTATYRRSSTCMCKPRPTRNIPNGSARRSS